MVPEVMNRVQAANEMFVKYQWVCKYTNPTDSYMQDYKVLVMRCNHAKTSG